MQIQKPEGATAAEPLQQSEAPIILHTTGPPTIPRVKPEGKAVVVLEPVEHISGDPLVLGLTQLPEAHWASVAHG